MICVRCSARSAEQRTQEKLCRNKTGMLSLPWAALGELPVPSNGQGEYSQRAGAGGQMSVLKPSGVWAQACWLGKSRFGACDQCERMQLP